MLRTVIESFEVARKKATAVPEMKGESQVLTAQTVRTDEVRRLLHSVVGTG
jgi:hypothetical protein